MSAAVCKKCQFKNVGEAKFCSGCGADLSTTSQARSKTYHFVVMGGGGVGKSSITVRFVSRQFASAYDPTIEDRFQKVVDHEGIPCVLEILDTAGQETFSAMRELYMKNGEGFLLVYSITTKRSLTELETIKTGIFKYKPNGCPMVLAGNKCDLEAKREVETKEAKELARQWGASFFECSAKTDANVSELFHSLIEQTWQRTGHPDTKKKSSGGCSLL